MTCDVQVTFDTALWKTVSRDLIDVCTQLLVKKQEKRLTIDNLLDHSWFKKLSPKFLSNLFSKDSL